MPSKEVVTFWLDMGAPMGLLSRGSRVLEKGRMPVNRVRRGSMRAAMQGCSQVTGVSSAPTS